MSAFDNLRLVFPQLWTQDWSGLLGSEHEAERLVYQAQYNHGLALRSISTEPVTPEKLAWIAIWARSYSLLSAALGVWHFNAKAEMWVLGRVRFELSSHLELLTQALLAGGDLREEAAKDHLRAYIAWSIWEEIQLLQQMLDPDNLAAAFDPQPTRDMLADLGPAISSWQKLTGQELELRSDQEAELDQRRAVAQFRERLALLESLLADPRLEGWAAKLRSRTVADLFQLLTGRKGVMHHLKSRRSAFAYSSYKRGSSAIHCTSLEAALVLRPTLAAPRFFDVEEQALDDLRDIVSLSGVSLVGLSALAAALD